jgi:uncharacterized DUF497 family protein
VRIRHLIWLDEVVEKLERKHQVSVEEVTEVFVRRPRFLFKERGRVEGEHLYNALGRTGSGRYLSVFFIYKKSGDALVITAREMTQKEKRFYAKK